MQGTSFTSRDRKAALWSVYGTEASGFRSAVYICTANGDGAAFRTSIILQFAGLDRRANRSEDWLIITEWQPAAHCDPTIFALEDLQVTIEFSQTVMYST